MEEEQKTFEGRVIISAAAYVTHSKRDFPVEKVHPHLSFGRKQWPSLLGHLRGANTRDDALASCLRLLELEKNVCGVFVDAPDMVGVLTGFVGASSELVEGVSERELVPASSRVTALRCLGFVLRHAGMRSSDLVEAVAPSLSAACCSNHAPLRLAAYQALAQAVRGSPSAGALACVQAGYADSLVLRLLSEIPEHGRGAPQLAEGAATALRELLCSSGGRTGGAMARALSSGAVTALLDAAQLPEASEILLDACLACLAAFSGDVGGGRPQLLAPATACTVFPLLTRLLSHRGPGGSMAIAASAASALASLAVKDEGKREALRAVAGMEVGESMPLPGPASAGYGLDALAQILMDACGKESVPPPPFAAQAALAACSAISTLAQHPVARFAFMAAPKIKRQVFEKLALEAREGRLGKQLMSEALERACTAAWDSVLWKP